VWTWPGNTNDHQVLPQVKDDLRGWRLGRLFLGDCPLAIGLVLVAVLPPDMSAPLLVHIARGNVALAVVMNALTTAVSPVVVPALFLLLTGVDLDVPVGRLVLELTENQPLANPILASELISRVRGLGCRVAIDDFGCAYSNPYRLLSIPHDIVKIDAVYVSDVRFGPDGQNSLYHMAGLAACTAPVVIVEGIESSDHLELARSAGATHVQGSFLATPALREYTV
jgi:EAL domain-containing protein (putative c-di-GMP-specific phosphodiesterase class I)